MENKQSRSLSEQILLEIAYLLNPLKRIDNAKNVFGLFNGLGYKLPASNLFNEGFPDLVSDIENLISKVEVIQEAAGSDDYLPLLLELQDSTQSVISLATKADGIRSEIEDELDSFPDFINNSGIASAEFPRRLFDYLLFLYLQTRQPQLFSVLHLIGIVEQEEFTATGNWEPVQAGSKYSVRRVQWERIADLFTDPKGLVDDVYSWNSDFEGDKFLHRMEILLKAFLIPGGIYKQNKALRDYFDRDPGSEEIRLPLYQEGQWPGNYKEFDLNLFPIPSKNSDKAGLALYPYIIGNVEQEFDLNETWTLKFKVHVDMESGIGLQIRPPAKLHVDNSLFSSPEDFINAHLEFGIVKKSSDDSLTFIFGSEDGSYWGFRKIGFNFITALDNGKEEIAAEMLINDLSLKIDMSEGDGFLQKILAGVKIETVSDLVIGISNLDGFHFRGSGALEIEIPLHKSLGPITFHSLYTRFTIADDMELQFAVSLGFKLGPITGSVEKIGIAIPFSISDQNKGNLGPVDVHCPVFVPPLGAGLSLNAGGIIGGGDLEFDNENKRYAGILSLKFGEIALVAIGLVTTRMPDGSEGFSLLVNIGVTFSPPIQLSMGFTLKAVGGLIGLNRIMDIEVLQTGIKNRTLDAILFPDPDTVIENAPKIISDLRAVFPPYPDRFVVGPMIKIGWGSPSIITGDIGIFIEFPEPIRIVLLGQIEAVLPKKENAVVVIHLDILGVLDLQKKELTFQACLYDSRLLTFDMYGDSAMLIGWGNDPRFAMSMGGFHPRFTPPPPPIIFAELRRLSISLSKSSSIRLSCASYQAITPNTLQFGARVDCYIAFAGATVTGYLGFDALFYFSPFSFVVDMGGGITVKYQGVTLAEIHLNCTLSGPNPWNAKGKVKFKVLFISIKKKFSITWGDPEKRRLASKDPWPDLKKAVEQTGSWSSALPPSSTIVATLRSMEDEGSNIAVVHPSGKLELRQNILPLGIALDKVGNAPITGHDKFEVEKITMENSEGEEEALEISGIYEHFSRGQYQKLSSSEKLSLPSFEKMKAGVSTDNDDFEIFGEIEETPLEYETILIDSDRTSKPMCFKRNSKRICFKGFVSVEEFDYMQQSLTDRRIRQSMSANKFTHPERRPMTSVPGEEKFYVANADDLKSSDITRTEGFMDEGLSRIMVDEILQERARLSPALANDMIVVTGDELIH